MINSVIEYLDSTCLIHPNKIALVDVKCSVPFRDLREKSRRIARLIHTMNSTKQSPILVFLPRNSNCIVSFCAILYSGNFYCPIDVYLPQIKIKQIIDTLCPKICISDQQHVIKLTDLGLERRNIIVLDNVDFSSLSEFDLESEIINTDLAYVLFTSGSTGSPKGVAVRQCSVIDFIDWLADKYKITSDDSILNNSSLSFDGSMPDVYLPLKTGATLHFYNGLVLDYLYYIQQLKITIIIWVPSLYIYVANKLFLNKINCNSLRLGLFCGEVMPNRPLNYWRRLLPNCLFVNLYGPTEVTYACTYFDVCREFTDAEPLPIGFPCKNTDILVLSDNQKLVTDPNVIGELCVRGICLAAGYWNDPNKTCVAFSQNPLKPELQEIIYHTGDLVYYNERHELMYYGRKDFQIKYMGYLIQPSNIETVAGGVDGIENVCCVLNKEHKEIVLFFQSFKDISTEKLRQYLLERLPKYEVPSHLIRIKEFPYNNNGKIDRVKLCSLSIT